MYTNLFSVVCESSDSFPDLFLRVHINHTAFKWAFTLKTYPDDRCIADSFQGTNQFQEIILSRILWFIQYISILTFVGVSALL